MIKVLVVIYGLVLFVPTGETNGKAETLKAVFVKGGHDGTAEHTPIVRYVKEDGKLSDPWTLPLADDFAISVLHTAGGVVHLDERERFISLGDLVAPRTNARIQRECLSKNDPFMGECTRRGEQDLTHGVVTFVGEWRTRAASYCCGLRFPVGDHDHVRYQFLGLADPPGINDRGQPVATALVLETLAAPEDLQVLLGNGTVVLPRLSEELCLRVTGDDDHECMVLVMGNPPVPSPDECVGTGCRRDRHFADFYDLATTPPVDSARRKVPYAVSQNVSCPCPDIDSNIYCLDLVGTWETPQALPSKSKKGPTGRLNWPSVRCPPAFAAPEE